jgi:hypothetical protein
VRGRGVGPEAQIAPPDAGVLGAPDAEGQDDGDGHRLGDPPAAASHVEEYAEAEGEGQERQRQVAVLDLEVDRDEVQHRQEQHAEGREREDRSVAKGRRRVHAQGDQVAGEERRHDPDGEAEVPRAVDGVDRRERRGPQRRADVVAEGEGDEAHAARRADHGVALPDHDHEDGEAGPQEQRGELPQDRRLQGNGIAPDPQGVGEDEDAREGQRRRLRQRRAQEQRRGQERAEHRRGPGPIDLVAIRREVGVERQGHEEEREDLLAPRGPGDRLVLHRVHRVDEGGEGGGAGRQAEALEEAPEQEHRADEQEQVGAVEDRPVRPEPRHVQPVGEQVERVVGLEVDLREDRAEVGEGDRPHRREVDEEAAVVPARDQGLRERSPVGEEQPGGDEPGEPSRGRRVLRHGGSLPGACERARRPGPRAFPVAAVVLTSGA